MNFTKAELQKELGNWIKYIPYPILKKTLNAVSEDTGLVYPDKQDIFKAFKLCNPDDLKVVILGQDPYHDGRANGLAFSNNSSLGKMSPSLRNIFKEVERDVYRGLYLDQDPDLSRWSKQGVLLLNTALTVRESSAESHLFHWMPFTIALLKNLSAYNSGIIYVLWGKKAQNFKPYINTKTNFILEAGHPSPLNSKNNFAQCAHFSKINAILKEQDKELIKW